MNTRSFKLFFFELIIVLFGFTLCSFVCVQIFSNAYRISQRSREISEAVVKAQAIAEAFKADDFDSIQLQQSGSRDSFVLYFDSSWKAVKNPSSRMLIMVVENDGPLASAHIAIFIEDTNLFSLTVCRQEEGKTP
jgi:hypothetical protein